MHFKFAIELPAELDTQSPFTNIESDNIWWKEHNLGASLMDNDLRVGKVFLTLGYWYAYPRWGEQPQCFDKEDEARAWLATLYRFR